MKSGGSQRLRQRPYRMRARAQAAEATAQAIIAAARALFAERPYDQVSLPAIAERAGVTVQTVLRRFGSKEELFAAAAHQRSGLIRADREAAPPGDLTHLVAHYERWGDEQAYLVAPCPHRLRHGKQRLQAAPGRQQGKQRTHRSGPFCDKDVNMKTLVLALVT
jgi:AcrR family transcriptional regulator